MSANDPLEELLIEAEDEANAEREERGILLQRVTELKEQIAELSKAVDRLTTMEKSEQMGKKITITQRDEYDRIKSFTVN